MGGCELHLPFYFIDSGASKTVPDRRRAVESLGLSLFGIGCLGAPWDDRFPSHTAWIGWGLRGCQGDLLHSYFVHFHASKGSPPTVGRRIIMDCISHSIEVHPFVVGAVVHRVLRLNRELSAPPSEAIPI